MLSAGFDGVDGLGPPRHAHVLLNALDQLLGGQTGLLSGPRLQGKQPTPDLLAQAAVHGYTTAFYWSAAIFAVAAVVCTALLRGGVHEPSHVGEPVLAH